MAQNRDYYEVLGVGRDASPTDVKRAFRRLARQCHPDVNPNDPEAERRFKEIGEAYEVLGDPDRRAEYDLYGRVSRSGAMAGDIWDEVAGFGSIFDAFFGPRTAGRPRPRRGADLRYDLEIDLEEVATGAEKQIAVQRLRGCEECGGTGSQSRSGERACSGCRGTGQARQTAATPFGRISTVTTCPHCAGVGTMIADPCPECRGGGRRPVAQEVVATIPAGIEDGSTLRLTGEGEVGERGAAPGDLYVVVHVRPHEIFERRGRDLWCEVPIPFTAAALGGEIGVPTLAGGVERVTVPAGTQTGEAFSVRGQGLPDVRTGVRGSQHVMVRVVTPRSLTPRQQELLSEFAREGGDEVDEPKGWFARLREALRGEEEG